MSNDRTDLPIVGIAEIAELTGVSKQTVTNWRSRNSDFPTPIAQLRSGPVWHLKQIFEWATERGIEMKVADVSEHGESVPRTNIAQTVAVVNMKGGVGKSTLTANLGWYCAYRLNKKV